MKRGLLTLLLGVSASMSMAQSTPQPELLGHWHFYKMIYQGNEMPPRDPKLNLLFEFFEDGSDRLYWTFNEGKTFCERKGHWKIDNGFLDDEVYWANPSNDDSCAPDPDMQVGHQSTAPFEMKNGDFHLFIDFGNDKIVYVFERIKE